jgi:copper(I)-binding protein
MTIKYGRFRGLAAVAVVAAGCATVGSARTIVVENAWARRAPMMASPSQGGHGAPAVGSTGNGAVYAVIKNSGSSPDTLLSAASTAARVVELHEARSEGGVMSMRPIARLPVPAGAALELKPGGYHVMLLGLTRELKPGETVPVTLTFERAGAVTVDATVR